MKADHDYVHDHVHVNGHVNEQLLQIGSSDRRRDRSFVLPPSCILFPQK
jgi:hypothetical protein